MNPDEPRTACYQNISSSHSLRLDQPPQDCPHQFDRLIENRHRGPSEAFIVVITVYKSKSKDDPVPKSNDFINHTIDRGGVLMSQKIYLPGSSGNSVELLS